MPTNPSPDDADGPHIESAIHAAEVAGSRLEFWTRFIRETGATRVAEIGVWRGEFSEHLLRGCPSIQRYYMVDPWRPLPSWNKPANVEAARFEEYRREALARTEFAADRRVVLRGTTLETVGEVADGSLDLIYIDGDHTLRGIAIDLIRWFPKAREGGWIGGDDFCESIWQHPTGFEPTFVFPFAVYFAQATRSRILGLPHDQFLISKDFESAHDFVDITGRYPVLSVRDQVRAFPRFRATVERIAGKLARRVRGLVR